MAGHADALRRLKSVAAADVYKADTLAGRLERTDSGVTWSYDDQYLPIGRSPALLRGPTARRPTNVGIKDSGQGQRGR